MLQPAHNPVLVPPSAGVEAFEAAAPVTYGGLIRSAREALEDAIVVSNGPAPSGSAGLQELLGYERFLYGAGGHLRQLATLADLRTDALRRLTSRLDQSSRPEVEDSTWLRAATIINTAHDLIATHLLHGNPRTAEAEDVVLGPASAAASREVIAMILDAVDGSRQLMHHVARAQQHRQGKALIPGRMFAHLHATNHVVSLCAKATMYDLAELPPDASSQLDQLQPALPSQLIAATPPVSTPMAALRVLRQLCHDQARGLTAASPASLRDVALLGARVASAEALPATADDRPLARLARVHAEDQLDAARAAWLTASSDLTTVVQGLTKAPGAYGAAVRTLLDHPLDQRTQRALLGALPALGRDAARTVQTLSRRGGLVTRQPVPLQPRTAWRPISDEHATTLTERFGSAALHSSRALAAVRDLQRMNTTATAPQPHQARQRQLSQSLEQRGLTPMNTDPSRDQLLAANEDAAAFYRRHLLGPDGAGPRDYLTQRGFAALLVDTPWTVGHAPAAWTALHDHLSELGYSDQTQLAAGLTSISRRGNLIDRFRDRLTFGIRDRHDQLVAFTARTGPEGREPKYLNTPRTALFDKSAELFGLGEATRRPADSTCVVVEGPLDAIAVSLADPSATAPLALCGTALTDKHAQTIRSSQYDRVILAFDDDAAGSRALERAAVTLSDPLITAVRSPGQDPAGLFASGGPTTLSEAVTSARPVTEVLVELHLARWPDRLDNAEAAIACVREAAATIARMKPPDVAALAVHLSEGARLPLATVTTELANALSLGPAHMPHSTPNPSHERKTGLTPDRCQVRSPSTLQR